MYGLPHNPETITELITLVPFFCKIRQIVIFTGLFPTLELFRFRREVTQWDKESSGKQNYDQSVTRNGLTKGSDFVLRNEKVVPQRTETLTRNHIIGVRPLSLFRTIRCELSLDGLGNSLRWR